MKKTVAFVLSLTLLLTASNINWDTVSAESIEGLNKQIEELKKDKLELKEKQSDIESDLSDTEQKIEENLEQQDEVQSDIDSIDQRLEETQDSIQAKENEITTTNQEIEDLTNKIEELNGQIEDLKEEIKLLEEKIAKREELLKDRLRSIQKNGGTMRYLEVLLGSSSFADFISRTAAVNIMMDQDKEIMETLKVDRITIETKKSQVEANKTEIEEKKVEVEEKKLALEDQKQELLALQGQLDQQLAEKEAKMSVLEEEHSHLEELKMTAAEEQEIINNQEAALQKAIELAKQEKEELEQLSKEESSSGAPALPSSGNGKFIWPVSGYLTDYFGTRGGRHYGIDVGNADARTGARDVPIYAAASGVVTRAYKSSSYGNVVFITHVIDGVQYETVYAHMKYSPMVNTLQVVQKGQQIGVMGSTGDSSGPHLHFEMHSPEWNGAKSNAINPLSYLN